MMLRASFLVAAILASFAQGAAVDVKSVINTAKKLRTQSENKVASVFGSLSGGGGGVSGDCPHSAAVVATKAAVAYCPATHVLITPAMCAAVAAGPPANQEAFDLLADGATGFLGAAITPSCTHTAGAACTDAEYEGAWTGAVYGVATALPVTPVAGAGLNGLVNSLQALTEVCFAEPTVVESYLPVPISAANQDLMVCECKKSDDTVAKYQAHLCSDSSHMGTAGCHDSTAGSAAFGMADADGDDVDYVEDLLDIGAYWGAKALIKNACTKGGTPSWDEATWTAMDTFVTTWVTKHATNLKKSLATWAADAGRQIVTAPAATKARCYYNKPV